MPATTEKKEWKGEIGQAWQGRRNVQLARDGRLVADVNRWKVTTRELSTALLDLPRTPSNIKIVERRTRQLAKHDFNQVTIDSATYNVTLAIGAKSKLERAQIQHRYMEALAASTMVRTGAVKEYLSGEELRSKDRNSTVIPDSFFKLSDTVGIFWENETGKSDYYSIIPRCQQYFEQWKLLYDEYKIENFAVVWNCRILSWVKDIAQDIQTKLPPEKHEMFCVTVEKHIDPFQPTSIFDKHYLSPVDMQLYHLWEE